MRERGVSCSIDIKGRKTPRREGRREGRREEASAYLHGACRLGDGSQSQDRHGRTILGDKRRRRGGRGGGGEGGREGGVEERTWTARAVSGMAVRARIGMEGRYLAMSRGVVPVSVRTTIIFASMSKAVLTEEEATDSGADMCPTTAMTVLRMVLDLREGGREGGRDRWRMNE